MAKTWTPQGHATHPGPRLACWEPNPTQHGRPLRSPRPFRAGPELRHAAAHEPVELPSPQTACTKAACPEPAPTAPAPHFPSRAPCNPTLGGRGPRHPAAVPEHLRVGREPGRACPSASQLMLGCKAHSPGQLSKRRAETIGVGLPPWGPRGRIPRGPISPSQTHTHVLEPGPRNLAAFSPEPTAQRRVENRATCVDNAESQSLLGG